MLLKTYPIGVAGRQAGRQASTHSVRAKRKWNHLSILCTVGVICRLSSPSAMSQPGTTGLIVAMLVNTTFYMIKVKCLTGGKVSV